jgi:hypothetical protein
MTDIAHLIGNDLTITSYGDVVMSNDVEEVQERVLRRLLSNPGSYYWHPGFGAGLARFLGQTLRTARIKGTIMKQILLERGVSKNPPPTITLTEYNGDTVVATIKYIDANTGATSLLTVPIQS